MYRKLSHVAKSILKIYYSIYMYLYILILHLHETEIRRKEETYKKLFKKF